MRENKAMIFKQTPAEGLLKQKLGYWLNLRVPSAKIAAHVTLRVNTLAHYFYNAGLGFRRISDRVKIDWTKQPDTGEKI